MSSHSPSQDPPPAHVDEGQGETHEEAHDEAPEAHASGNAAPTVKVKKKKKGSGTKPPAPKRGPTALPKNRGTGFEEYFADPPMTPDEAVEEKTEIYARDLPFETRIQSCIQRFRGRRRLQTEQVRYFDEYLFLGGIDTMSNPFGGHHSSDLRSLTPAERRDATATDTVHAGSAADERFYRAGDDHWSVDFAGVLAGFLSTSLLTMTGGIRRDLEAATAVVENFLRYVQHHDVCPEYEQDVGNALRLCADAKLEWPLLGNLRASMPGSFHLAAADLFPSSLSCDGWTCPAYPRPENFDAKAVFYSACALLGETQALTAAQRGGITVTQEYDCTLEVVSVQLPPAGVAEKFRLLVVGETQHLAAPIGKAFFKPATIDDGWVNPAVPSPGAEACSWLYFEQPILDDLKPGMKMTLTVVELDVGIRFVRALTNLVPSFYSFLPQVLMKHYKAPRPSERPAPSVHNPEADEKQHAKEAQDGY